MRVNIERLRFWFLGLAILLAAGVLAFLGHAHWRARQAAREVPPRLGGAVQQSMQGFTFSKSEGGHTFFTLHAARTVQYKKDGRVELRDVSITLFDPQGKPADRIYGEEFEYNPTTGIVRAIGTVDIDLQGPEASNAAQSLGPSNHEEHSNQEEPKTGIHAKTFGLIFEQKTGKAFTDHPIQFQVSETRGSAIGASFDSHEGVLVLDHDVDLESSLQSAPLKVLGQRAEFHRDTREFHLTSAIVEYRGSHSSSDSATIFFRRDGTASRAEVQGQVRIASGSRHISADQATAILNAASRPERILFHQNVAFSSEEESQQVHGTADSASLLLAANGVARQGILQGGVSILDREQAGQQTTNRELHASRVNIAFESSPGHPAMIRTMTATGKAGMRVEKFDPSAPPGKGREQTEVHGDTLHVTLRQGSAIESLDGTGNTRLTQIGGSGETQSSTADELSVKFAPAPAAAGAGKGAHARKAQRKLESQPNSQLLSMTQRGNVVLTQTIPARRAGSPGSQHAAAEERTTTITAGLAVYQAAGQLVRLTGNPRLHDASGDLSARVLTYHRSTGNTEATGGVAALYRPSSAGSAIGFGGKGPANIVAERATFDQVRGVARFYGGASQGARLWQGDDSVSAPQITLSRANQSMEASGKVLAVFTGATLPGSAGSGAGASHASVAAANRLGRGSAFTISSRSLLYSGTDGAAHFQGDVTARNAQGVLRARQMDVTFTHANPANVSTPGHAGAAEERAGPSPAQQIQQIIASGDVHLEEPGQSATGEKLVYTAQEGTFVLTGGQKQQPRFEVKGRGTVTGESLIFNNRDDSVLVRGGRSGAVTETRITQ